MGTASEWTCGFRQKKRLALLESQQKATCVLVPGLSEVFHEDHEDTAELEYCKTDDQAADIITKALEVGSCLGPIFQVS
jgi:hypothetical protein